MIEREFGVRYDHDPAGVILARVGVTHRKSMRRARERDEAQVGTFRRDVWPGLVKKVPTRAGSSWRPTRSAS